MLFKTIFKRVSVFVFLIFIVTLFSQCSNNQAEHVEVNNEFKKYISAFTSNVISNQANISIEFESETSKKLNNNITENLFEFSPAIEGDIFWNGKNTIIFNPMHLEPGTNYKVAFHLNKLLPVTKGLEVFEFNFKTITPSLLFKESIIKPASDESLIWNVLNSEINTSDYLDPDLIEKGIKVFINQRELPVSWRHTNQNKTHFFEVDSIKRTEFSQEIQIRWNGHLMGMSEDGIEIIEFASLNDFKLIKTITPQDGQQFISLLFSDPIDKNQELRGLIQLGGIDDLTFDISNNEIKVYPKEKQTGSLILEISADIKNMNGFRLSEFKSVEVFFEAVKPQIKLLGKGVLIPDSDGILFPFQTINLTGVIIEVFEIFDNNVIQFLQRNDLTGNEDLSRVGRIVYKDALSLSDEIEINQWQNFSVDISQLIETSPGAIYRVKLSMAPSQSLYGCIDEELKAQSFNFEPVNYEGLVGSYYNSYFYNYNYSYDDGYSWREKENPCNVSYYLRNNHSVVRNMMASEYGIIAKQSENNKYNITITNLKTSQPSKGVNVKLLNYQNQELISGKTDVDGFIEFEMDTKAYLLIAEKNESISYLRLDDGSSLSLSMFDVSGYEMKNGTKGFIYGERDIWRPGDSLYLSFILQDKDHSIPLGHPVKFELYDPQNVLVSSKTLNKSDKNIYDFRIKTDDDALTGNYRAYVKIGNASFHKNLKIETIKPNRLKVSLKFPDDILYNHKNNYGKLKVNWLHGAIAKNLKAEIDFSLLKAKTQFKDFNQYHFEDNAKTINFPSKSIFSGTIDSLGEAKIKAEINILAEAPGMLKAVFETKVFEAGGDFSTNYNAIPFSPYESYVGLIVPKGKGWRDALKTNVEHIFPIATVDKEGRSISRDNLKVEVFKLSWRWWWESDRNSELARYVNKTHSNLIYSTTASSKDGYGSCKIKFKDDEYGRFYVRITDEKSQHSTGKVCFVDWPYFDDGSSGNSDAANMLLFNTDKEDYQLGDVVNINFKSSKGGNALITLESGNKILDKFWVETEGGETKFSFKTTEDMSPNVYVGIHYIQNHNATSNDLPIRMYGVQRVKVNNPKTLLKPDIEAPKSVEPEKDFEITISEENGKEMEYTLAIVDEGLLDISNFNTPNPVKYFYSQEALGIKTWDMYDFVMSAFSGKMTSLLSTGGDGDIKSKKAKKPNRFKPIVKFLGPYTLKKGARQKHTIQINNYIGSVKAMVIAAKDLSYGSSQELIKVKKPLMVLATAPRILGIEESFSLPVTVFNMDEKKKDVKVEVLTNDLINVVQDSTKYIHFDASGDKMLYFKLQTTASQGFGTITVKVSSGKDVAEQRIDIETRNPSQLIHQSFETLIESGQSWKHDLKIFGSQGTNKTAIEISTIPPLGLDKRLDYLIRYPHGCIEQTTSSVFPQLVLENLTELSSEQKLKVRKNINQAIRKIKRFQISSGGFAYWEGGLSPNDWGTSYAGHFMIKAKENGYFISDHVFSNWVAYQKYTANSWSVSEHYHHLGEIKSQAYRLFTLALSGNTEIGAMNRLKEIRYLPGTVKALLAAAYHLNGQTNIARELARSIDLDKLEDESGYGYNYGSSERDKALIIYCLAEMDMHKELEVLVTELSAKLNSNKWMSTQTTAVSLVAISNFVGDDSSGSFIYAYQIPGQKENNVESKKAISSLSFTIEDPGKVKIRNTNDKALFVKLIQSGIPLNQKAPDSNSRINMKLNYYDQSGKEIDPTRLSQGTDFTCVVKVTNLGGHGNYRDLALSQLFPAGWEILNQRINSESTANHNFTYQDIRDDKVLTYFDLNVNSTKSITVNLNASYLGEFFMPGTNCEAMYDNKINANTGGGWVKVIK